MSQERADDASEPLIDQSSVPITYVHTSPESEQCHRPRDSTRQNGLRCFLLACGLSALLDFTVFMGMAPETDIMESIICRNHYNVQQVSQNMNCKNEAIQAELAMLQGWGSSFEQFPPILFALPYGAMADNYGRKPVLFLFLLGLFLSDLWIKTVYLLPDTFSLRLIWLAPLIHTIGGGGQVGDFVICTIIADVVPDQDRIGAFLKLTAADLIAQIVATPSAAAMMKKSSWYPLGLKAAFLTAGFLISSYIPETRPLSSQTLTHGEEGMDSECLHTQPSGGPLQKFRDSVRVLFARPAILSLLFAFFLACFSAQSLHLLLQYTSKKFQLDYSTASLVTTFRSVVHLFLVTVLMPMADRYMIQRLRLEASQKDLLLSQGSCILLVLGHFILGLSGSSIGVIVGLIMTALGSAFLVTMRSAMTSLVSPSSIGILYTSVTVAHGLANLTAGPSLALIFRWGMSLGDDWLGLPFLVTSILNLTALLVILCSIQSRRHCSETPNSAL